MRRRRGSVVLASLLCACQDRAPARPTPARPVPSAPSAPDAAPATPPALPRVAYLELPVPGFGDAVVSIPQGAGAARPVVLVAHGNMDLPEAQCRAWRYVLGNRAFALCTRGVQRADSSRDAPRFTYADADHFARELEAALRALRERFGARVAEGPVGFAGFSLGAILGRAWLERTAVPVGFAVLLEEGSALGSSARAFARSGVRRVLLGCGQSVCVQRARADLAPFARAGIEARLVDAVGEGHSYGGRVAQGVHDELEWLVGDDARFARPLLAP